MMIVFFFFSSRRRHTRCGRDWSSDVCSSDLNYFKDTTQKWAVLTPKSKDMGKHIKEVTFWFKNGENAVSEIKIVENNDDYSVDRKSTRLNSSHVRISYAVFCLKKKTKPDSTTIIPYSSSL